jgi:serine/threonine protein kinase
METLISQGQFTLGKKIGQGAFGTIYEGVWQECGVSKRKVAIKTEPVSNG